MISGYLQSAVLAGLDGANGIVAWRWVFIIDGLITVVISLYGMIFFPDTPERTTAFYFTEEDKRRSLERMIEDDREPQGKLDKGTFGRCFQSWQLYVLTILWM